FLEASRAVESHLLPADVLSLDAGVGGVQIDLLVRGEGGVESEAVTVFAARVREGSYHVPLGDELAVRLGDYGIESNRSAFGGGMSVDHLEGERDGAVLPAKGFQVDAPTRKDLFGVAVEGVERLPFVLDNGVAIVRARREVEVQVIAIIETGGNGDGEGVAGAVGGNPSLPEAAPIGAERLHVFDLRLGTGHAHLIGLELDRSVG